MKQAEAGVADSLKYVYSCSGRRPESTLACPYERKDLVNPKGRDMKMYIPIQTQYKFII